MRYFHTLILLLGVLPVIQPVFAQETIKVRLDVTGAGPILRDSVTVRNWPVHYLDMSDWEQRKQKLSNGILELTIPAASPFMFQFRLPYKAQKSFIFLAEPGDDITVTWNGQHYSFSGKGAEKATLKFQMDSLLQSLPEPANPSSLLTHSLHDYFEWNQYLDRQLAFILPLIDGYKTVISSQAYTLIKADFIGKNIYFRSHKFGSLIYDYAAKSAMSRESICAIYDTSYYPATNKLFAWVSNHLYSTPDPLKFTVARKHAFDFSRWPLNSSIKRKLLYYEEARQVFEGITWESFMADFFPEQFMREEGFIPETQKLLADYYTTPGFPEFKTQMRKAEQELREKYKGRFVFDFTLSDKAGRQITRQAFTGKTIVLFFWHSGCMQSRQMMTVVRNVEKKFAADSSIAFLYISTEKNKAQWLRSLQSIPGGIQLYTSGEGEHNSLIKDCAILTYPGIFVMDNAGSLLNASSAYNPSIDNGKRLSQYLQKQISIAKDGPYVIHNAATSIAYYINGTALSEKNITPGLSISLPVQTDGKKRFSVTLKKENTTEPVEWKMPPRLFVLSDIEGNFDSFRKLLKVHGVIDDHFNWTFGRGHLVFAGDMFDRGLQVTECLWLLYSLEEKAKIAGGYVHFILGNHEIMNLQGDHRYAQKKYKENANLTGKSIAELYGQDSELGRWLRSKNIVEKIGSLLFLHGGVSAEINQSSLTLTQINSLARPYYARTLQPDHDADVKMIMNSSSGLFWFRGYYKNKLPEKVVASTLQKFSVRHIITGHTIIADTISVHYGGKVINTDTKHAAGKSEALLIEGGKFYRVDQAGNRVLLFTDIKKERRG